MGLGFKGVFEMLAFEFSGFGGRPRLRVFGTAIEAPAPKHRRWGHVVQIISGVALYHLVGLRALRGLGSRVLKLLKRRCLRRGFGGFVLMSRLP